MATNTTTPMKLCSPCVKIFRVKKSKRQLKSKTHLINTGQNVKFESCKSLYEPQNKEAHLQSQQWIACVKRTHREVFKILLRDMS